MMKQIVSQLKNSRDVLLATHINPDGDAIGSLVCHGIGAGNTGQDNNAVL